jgi:multiple sugar transport system ATP-binding protein
MQQLGTPHEVYNRPANTFVAGFIGNPRMNLVKARLAPHGDGLALVIQDQGAAAVQIELPAALVTPALAQRGGGTVIAGIRAEAVTLAAAGAPVAAGALQRCVTARVEVIEPTGGDTLAVLDLGGHEFTARLEPDLALLPGQDARFLVDLGKLVCFDAQTELLIA